MSESSSAPNYLKEQIMRASIVLTAADIMLKEGPAKVTCNRVAKVARIPQSQVLHYFDSIDWVLREAANCIADLMRKRSEEVVREAEKMRAEEIRGQIVDLLIKMCLPDDDSLLVCYYKQMLLVDEEKLLNEVFQKRRRNVNLLAEWLLRKSGSDLDARMLIIQIDGAVLQAISEGG